MRFGTDVKILGKDKTLGIWVGSPLSYKSKNSKRQSQIKHLAGQKVYLRKQDVLLTSISRYGCLEDYVGKTIEFTEEHVDYIQSI